MVPSCTKDLYSPPFNFKPQKKHRKNSVKFCKKTERDVIIFGLTLHLIFAVEFSLLSERSSSISRASQQHQNIVYKSITN